MLFLRTGHVCAYFVMRIIADGHDGCRKQASATCAAPSTCEAQRESFLVLASTSALLPADKLAHIIFSFPFKTLGRLKIIIDRQCDGEDRCSHQPSGWRTHHHWAWLPRQPRRHDTGGIGQGVATEIVVTQSCRLIISYFHCSYHCVTECVRVFVSSSKTPSNKKAQLQSMQHCRVDTCHHTLQPW